MAKQQIIDLYNCDENILNDEEKIKEIAKNIVESIGAKIVEEHIKKFEPIGITYFAIISTSHFSIHTWPENNYCAVDLFSCSDIDEELITENLKKYFKSNKAISKIIERRISG